MGYKKKEANMIDFIIIRIIVNIIGLGIPYLLIHNKRKETLMKDMIVIFILLNIGPMILDKVDPHNKVSTLMLMIIVIFELVIHEFGHVLLAWIIKGKVESVEFGFGKTLLTIGKVKFKMLPFMGKVHCKYDYNHVSALWFLSGGLILQTIVITILSILMILGFNSPLIKVMILLLLIDGLLNLLPIYKMSDGYKMVQILKRMKEESAK